MGEFGEYYLNGINLESSTAVYTSDVMTTLAPTGYYSDGEVTRFQSSGGLGVELLTNGELAPPGTGWTTVDVGVSGFAFGFLLVTTLNATTTNLARVKQTSSSITEPLKTYVLEYQISAIGGTPTFQYHNGYEFVSGPSTVDTHTIEYTRLGDSDEFKINIQGLSNTDTMRFTEMSLKEKEPDGLKPIVDCPLCSTVSCTTQVSISSLYSGRYLLETTFGSAVGAIKVTVTGVSNRPLGMYLEHSDTGTKYMSFSTTGVPGAAYPDIIEASIPASLSYFYSTGGADDCSNWNDVLMDGGQVTYDMYSYNPTTDEFEFTGDTESSGVINRIPTALLEYTAGSLIQYIPKADVADITLIGQFDFPCGASSLSQSPTINIQCPEVLPTINQISLRFATSVLACESSSLTQVEYHGVVRGTSGVEIAVRDFMFQDTNAEDVLVDGWYKTYGTKLEGVDETHGVFEIANGVVKTILDCVP